MKFPVALLLIFCVITVAGNWETITNLPPAVEEKAMTVGKIVLLTPYRIANSAWESFTDWQQTGRAGDLGAMVLYGVMFLALFLFLQRLIGWGIGFFRPFASEERQSFVAFVATLALIALAVGTPFDPSLVVSVVLLLFAMWVCIKVFERWRKPKKATVGT